MASEYVHDMTSGNIPVSYTHLDVYKRQVKRIFAFREKHDAVYRNLHSTASVLLRRKMCIRDSSIPYFMK